MNGHQVLWVYIVLVLVGGVMGFVKAKSKVSIIASTISAAVLALFALDKFPFRYHVVILALLLAMFLMRLVKTKKFMPNGLMVGLTIVTLALTSVLPP